MCGITVIYNPHRQLDQQDVKSGTDMAKAMLYRGPDEEGKYQNTHIFLGHRRLSIIDLASGQQPMHSICGNYIIVFNGEIYNHRKLKEQLISQGARFKTNCDTEVLLAGYVEWGENLLQKLNGMYAFCIYDKQKNEVFCARDPLGKKPFYYSLQPDKTLLIASDMQSLCASGQIKGEISSDGIQYYFGLGYIPAPHTIYTDVQKLAAGHSLVYSAAGLSLQQFWDIELSSSPPDNDRETFKEIFALAVADRLESEVPLGAFLSGGIDSNLVVSAMCNQSKSRVNTYTAGFSEKSTLTGVQDERPTAAEAAQEYGCKNTEILVSPAGDFLLPKLVPFLGEPFADASIIPTYLICKEAKKHVTVVLTGDGGDEPFGGYIFRYASHLLENKIRKWIPQNILKSLAGILYKWWPDHSSLPRLFRLKTLWRNLSVSPDQAYYYDQSPLRGNLTYLTPAFAKQFRLPAELVSRLYNYPPGKDEITKMLYTDTKLFMTEDVLVKADRMSMANSLELRSPLLDKKIINFAFSLPSQKKVKNGLGKIFLREFAKGLVAAIILNKSKTGFSIPTEQYLRENWREQFEKLVLTDNQFLAKYVNMGTAKECWRGFLKGNNKDFHFLWLLLVLACWHEYFHKNQPFPPSRGDTPSFQK